MNTTKALTWAPIIPLIGGLPLAAEKAFGTKPSFVISWSPFQHNDRHYVKYIRSHGWDGKYYVLDKVEESVIPDVTADFDVNDIPQVDVICGCPPCAGLSSFSVTSGADNPTNDHMINAANLVLSILKPKVYMFENAPHLATKKGRPIADKLYQIANDNDYTLMLYTTESRLHDNCQIRPRTFGFFVSKKEFSNKTLKVKDVAVKFSNYIDMINELNVNDSDIMNVPINKDKPSNDAFYQYCYQHIGAESHEDFVDKMCTDGRCKNLIVETIKLGEYKYLEIADWMDEHNFNKVASRVRYMQSKVDQGKGYWTHGITLAKQETPAFIGVMPYCLVHPKYDRYITFREALYLMKMPDDFCLDVQVAGKDANHICQNVPVRTAEDMFKIIQHWFSQDSNATNSSDYTVIKHKHNDAIEERGTIEKMSIDEYF